ncbi:MAG TPA: glycosyltransferase [Gaiellaceae bacterium]|jgi:glycosyltransferase involved in cell wall biosynthesis/peptidoglycan/xylan/chitin deacetylase (PgdA/CDA1 family)
MRILFLTPTLGTGGAERLTVTYALGMLRRGHEVAVAHGVSSSQAGPLLEAGVETVSLSRRHLSARTLPEWIRRLRRVVGSYRPDVVHAQSVTAALAARLAAPGVPQLVTIHGISQSDEALAALILRGAAGRLTAVSDASAAGLHRHRWAPPVEVLSPGIDVKRVRASAAAAKPPFLPGRPSLCCVARQDQVKGVDVLLRALPAVAESLPEVQLTLVGTGAEVEANRALAGELGIAERVHFAGVFPDATPYIAAAELMVLPSRREGLPVVALEALALERPLVATAVGGTPSVVVDGETGWLVPPENPQRLAEAIVSAGTDPAEAARRARAGRTLVEERFGAQPMLDRIETLLEGLARSATATPGTKPRPYYRAARAQQQARIAVARRRRQAPWTGVRIFGYHRVVDEDDVYAVRPAAFRAHMERVLASDTVPVRLDAALDLLQEPVEGRYVCVTFDDGYLDTLEHALPVLEELGIPATIFAVADILDGRASFDWYDSPPPALGWEHMPGLLESGLVDVQAHSRTHARLTALTEAELRNEVAGAKARLEERLRYRLSSFCYPAGIYGEREARAVLDAGFRAGVTTRAGVNAGGGPLSELRRTMVYWGDGADDFSAKLDGLLDRVSSLSERMQSRRASSRARAGTRRAGG